MICDLSDSSLPKTVEFGKQQRRRNTMRCLRGSDSVGTARKCQARGDLADSPPPENAYGDGELASPFLPRP